MSTPADLVIRGGTIVRGDGVRRGNVAVKSGKIVAITDVEFCPATEQTIDATGLHVFPGMIDPHVHLREPSNNDREDFLSGTMACAAGGITTFVEHPISTPSVHSAEILRKRVELVEGKAIVDYGFYGGAGDDNLGEIAGLAQAGVFGFKTFLPLPSPGREVEFRGLVAKDTAAMYEILETVARTGLPALFHLEDHSLAQLFTDRVKQSGRRDAVAHILSRPEIVEVAAVAELLTMAEDTGCRVQLVHMSSPRSVALAKFYKARGLDIHVETCPHYIVCCADDALDAGPFSKINPPLRSRSSMMALWPYIHDGTIDTIVSDHSPFLPEEKQNEDIFAAPPGHPGLETLFPVMLNEVAKGRLSFEQLASLLSENAARLLRLPNKGGTYVGNDADFVLVDMNEQWTIRADNMYSKSRGSGRFFEGLQVSGRLVKTILRGHVIMQDGEIVGRPGFGRWLRPQGVRTFDATR